MFGTEDDDTDAIVIMGLRPARRSSGCWVERGPSCNVIAVVALAALVLRTGSRASVDPDVEDWHYRLGGVKGGEIMYHLGGAKPYH